jgi:hypothetical protein
MLPRVTPLRAAVASGATAALLLTGGVAAAATGTLPGAAQDTARDMLATIGVTVPGADEAAAGHADQRGPVAEDTGEVTPVEAPADEQTDGAAEDDAQSGQGAEVSELARTTEATGADKGAEISGFASDGKSKAGQHGATAPETPAVPDAAGNADEAGQPEAPSTVGQDAAAQHRR